MRNYLLALTIGLVIASSGSVEAKGAKKARASKKAKAQAESALSTDVRFDDSVLHGTYQVPDEALAKVENEKSLNDLLGVRKHFKDRLAEAASQE
jgi:hypothetical protein